MTRLHIRNWTLIPSLNRLEKDGDEVVLEPKVSAFLEALIQANGQPVSKEEFSKLIWEGRIVSDDALLKIASKARRVLGDDAQAPLFIETVRGKGYRLIPPPSPGPKLTPSLQRYFPLASTAILLMVLIFLFWPEQEKAPEILFLNEGDTAVRVFDEHTGSWKRLEQESAETNSTESKISDD